MKRVSRKALKAGTLAAWALTAAGAAAQVPGPGNFTPANPDSALAKLGQRLLNNGIYLRSNYTGDAAGNVSGGHKQGADYALSLIHI